MSDKVGTHSKAEIHDSEILEQIDALDLCVGSRKNNYSSEQKSSQDKVELEEGEIVRTYFQIFPEYSPSVVENGKVNFISHLLVVLEDHGRGFHQEPEHNKDGSDGIEVGKSLHVTGGLLHNDL